MAISKMMRTALKALSYTDLDLTKTYELQRKLVNVKKYNPALLLYKMWDHTVRFEDHDIPVRIFTPPEEEGRRLLLFFHGGGWVTGNIDSYSRVCADMARETSSLPDRFFCIPRLILTTIRRALRLIRCGKTERTICLRPSISANTWPFTAPARRICPAPILRRCWRATFPASRTRWS